MQAFNTQFTLTRDYLAECYDQSTVLDKPDKLKQGFPLLLFAVGLALLLLTDQPKIVGSILVALGVLELIHFKFKRSWWLMRQLWGRSANTEVILSITDKSIETKNPYTKTCLLWTEVAQVIETELGIIFVAKNGGRQYLSKSIFPDALVSELVAMSPLE